MKKLNINEYKHMKEIDDSEVKQEVEQFFKEREKIKKIIDSIDKSKRGPLSKIVDTSFIVLLIFLVIARFIFNWIDNTLSLELGLLLLSAKIIWLIEMQNSYNHFIFMIMHTIDHNQNQMLEMLYRIEEKAKTEEVKQNLDQRRNT